MHSPYTFLIFKTGVFFFFLILIFKIYLFLLFILFLKLFNWRLITLQYGGGFCHTTTWISHRCTCVPPSWNPLPPPYLPHPSDLSQSTSFECPASCKTGVFYSFYLIQHFKSACYVIGTVPSILDLMANNAWPNDWMGEMVKLTDN